jgi:hypothetical protein
MAELKASEIKYSQPLVTKIGGVLFTATTIETPASAEYQEVGSGKGIELNLAKLGLTDEAVLGAVEVTPVGAVGETASTTAVPIAAWSTPLQTAKKAAENELQTVCFLTAVTLGKGKLYLRIFAQETAGLKEPLLEPKTSTKAAISLCSATIFVLGK